MTKSSQSGSPTTDELSAAATPETRKPARGGGRHKRGVASPPTLSPPPAALTATKGKIGGILALLRRDEGATIATMMAATGWQAHSVRGAIAGSIKKKLGLTVLSEKAKGERRYRIAPEPSA